MLEALLATYLVLSLATTIVVFWLDYFEKRQALLQALVVWVVPFVGALLILIFQSVVHRNMTTSAGPDAESKNSKDGDADALYFELDSSD